MKVAVLVSGLITGNYVKRNNMVQKNKFPMADFYYGTWETEKEKFETHFPNETAKYFKEPDIHYHPYMDIKTNSIHFQHTKKWIIDNKKLDWSKHHTKQILIHAWLVDTLKEDYDVIIRTRFDGYIWDDTIVDYNPFIDDVCKNNRTIGFSCTRKEKFQELYESDYHKEPKMREWILDQLIIHPYKFIDVNLINELHNTKRLKPAEHGWHQILSEPHGNNHRNYHGWVNHDKNIAKQFLKS